MTTLASSRTGFRADSDARFVSNPLAALRRTWGDALLYRRTLAELRALSARELDDLGLSVHDLRAIARRAVYA